MTAVSIKNVSVAYDGKPAAERVTFTLDSGDFLAIVGENGSGKSTLVKALIGIIPLESGEIVFGKTRRQTGYVPQQTKARQDFPASVSEVVISGRVARLGLLPFFTAEDKKIAAKYMEKLGISELANQPYSCISGGEQRRVLLARAFCAANDLLVLDEPTAGLDPVIASEFYRLLREFKEETSATTIMVSHDVEAAVENAGKILHMERGVKFFGSCQEYTATELGKNFMGCYHG